MKVIDYENLFQQHGVPFTLRGQTVQGNIGFACPLCEKEGDPDPSMHAAIDPRTGAWNCWRNAKHSGGRPHYPLHLLFGVSFSEIDDMLGFAPRVDMNAPPVLSALSEQARDDYKAFVPLTHSMATAHRKYLHARGVDDAAIKRFGIMAGVIGLWAWRVVFPVRNNHGEVVTWTARSIGNSMPKYRALGKEHGANIKAHLFGGDVKKDGRCLVVVEGPMDAVVLKRLAPYSTIVCIFGLKPSDDQLTQINMAYYTDKFFLFDSTAFSNACWCARQSDGRALDFRSVIGRHGDPGDLTESDKPALTSAGIF